MSRGLLQDNKSLFLILTKTYSFSSPFKASIKQNLYSVPGPITKVLKETKIPPGRFKHTREQANVNFNNFSYDFGKI